MECLLYECYYHRKQGSKYCLHHQPIRGGQQVKEVCEMCGIEGEGTTAWGGWCHDCDNQLGDVANG